MSMTQASFNPYDLKQQEIAYFNRAVGHAYKALEAREKIFFAQRAAKRETALENADINVVGILLYRRGIRVSFQDIHSHVTGRALALKNGDRSYVYAGQAYSAPQMNYYVSPTYNSFAVEDAFFVGMFGALVFDAVESDYMNQQYETLNSSGYFDGGFDSIQTSPDVVVTEGASGMDDPGFAGTGVGSGTYGSGFGDVTTGDFSRDDTPSSGWGSNSVFDTKTAGSDYGGDTGSGSDFGGDSDFGRDNDVGGSGGSDFGGGGDFGGSDSSGSDF